MFKFCEICPTGNWWNRALFSKQKKNKISPASQTVAICDRVIEKPFASKTPVGPGKHLLHNADRFAANTELCSFNTVQPSSFSHARTSSRLLWVLCSFQRLLLLARLMGQHCFAGCRLSSSVVVCNAAGRRAGRPPGAWERGVGTLPAVGPAGRASERSGGRHCTAGQSCYVPLGRHFVFFVSATVVEVVVYSTCAACVVNQWHTSDTACTLVLESHDSSHLPVYCRHVTKIKLSDEN